VDGATLEALRKKTRVWRECEGPVLGGKMLGMVKAFSYRPLWQLNTQDAAANDKRFATEILAAVPVGACWSSTWGASAVCGSMTSPLRRSFWSPACGRRPRLGPCGS
jgi:hypothetical protein